MRRIVDSGVFIEGNRLSVLCRGMQFLLHNSVVYAVMQRHNTGRLQLIPFRGNRKPAKIAKIWVSALRESVGCTLRTSESHVRCSTGKSGIDRQTRPAL